MSPPPLSFVARLAFAWVCFWKALFDGTFAAELSAALSAPKALPPSEPGEVKEPERGGKAGPPPTDASALALLSLLQRDGRLIDFLTQDITSFGDADVGAAARVVHEGARKVLVSHVKVEAIRSESEGGAVVLPQGYDAKSVKLTGNVHGAPPYKGTLRHKGWRATFVSLPTPTLDHDATVLAPAEVEL